MANRPYKPRKQRRNRPDDRRGDDRRGPDRRPGPRHNRGGPPRRNFDLRLVTPDGWTSKGEAVVSSVGMPVFGGIPKERAEVAIRPGRNRDYATFERTKTPSPHRVKPPCTRYAPCGGCPLMHVDEPGQVAARATLLHNVMRSFDLDVQVLPERSGPDGLEGYRHVSKLVAGVSDQGHPRLGAPARHTRRIVPIPNCNILTPALRKLTRAAAGNMLGLEIYPYVHGRGGLLRYIHARQSRSTGQIIVTFVATKHSDQLRDLADRLAGECPDVVGVHLHMNTREDNTIFDRREDGTIGTMPLFGTKFIEDELAGVRFRIGPTDFFQTNPGVADVLYRDVIELAQVRQGVPVVDLYCGVGGFALALSRVSGWAVGVETQLDAVMTARAAASASRLPAEFIPGEVADALPQLQKRLAGKHPVVIVDPARRGLEDGVGAAVRALEPRRVVYVSCAPMSCGRDLREFVDNGYKITHLQPYAMFPHTAHTELVAVLEPIEPVSEPTGRAPQRRIVKR
jgi:23S rRNA (uracil1939-C5)-methyltransferase